MITVTALADCVYRGRFISPGELLTLPASDAAVLRYQGKVALSTDTNALSKLQQPDPPKRRYRRRNLTAEE